MSEWGGALIAAGSAVAGSIVTGWYTRSAGLRQAEAAKHAGDRQADALLRTVQETLNEQRWARIEDRRHTTYSEFQDAAEEVARDPRNNDLVPALHRALSRVWIEGPDAVTGAAINCATIAQNPNLDTARVSGLIRARMAYTDAVRDALGIRREPVDPGPGST
ncbi:hypothetical protein ACWCPD_25705 [Streptomyces sp. NPDC001935]